jgi:hypothetical protein
MSPIEALESPHLASEPYLDVARHEDDLVRVLLQG